MLPFPVEFVGAVREDVSDRRVVVGCGFDLPVEDERVVRVFLFGPEMFFTGSLAECVVVDLASGRFPVVIVALRDFPAAEIGAGEEGFETCVGVM